MIVFYTLIINATKRPGLKPGLLYPVKSKNLFNGEALFNMKLLKIRVLILLKAILSGPPTIA